MHKTIKLYSAPVLVSAGTVVTRTLGDPVRDDIEFDTSMYPFVKAGI